MKKYLFIVLLVGVCDFCWSQLVPAWSKTYGSNGTDELKSFDVHDQNIYLMGTNEIIDDPWIIRTRWNGNESFSSGIEGLENAQYLKNGIIDNENNIIITGETQGSSFPTFVTKLDLGLNEIWSQNYDGLGGGLNIIQKFDSNYVLVKKTWNDPHEGIAVTKLENNGAIMWNSQFEGTIEFGGILNEGSSNIILTTQDIPGINASSNSLIRLNDNGQYENLNSSQGNGIGDNVNPIALSKNYNGGYIYSTVILNEMSMRIISTDSLGIQEWEATFDGVFDHHGDIVKTQDSSYIFAADRKLFKISQSGELIWEYEIPLNDGYLWGYIKKIIEIENGRYLVGGTTYSTDTQHDFWLVNLVDPTTIPCFDPTQAIGDLDNDGEITILDLNLHTAYHIENLENECFDLIGDINQDGINSGGGLDFLFYMSLLLGNQ